MVAAMVAGTAALTWASGAIQGPATTSAASTQPPAAGNPLVSTLLGRMSLADKLRLLEWATATGQQAAILPGLRRLGLPALHLAEGPLGTVRQPPAALTSPLGVAATFSRADAFADGAVLGRDARALGQQAVARPFGVIDAGAAGERAGAGFGEDPLLAGGTAAAEISGIQAQGTMAVADGYPPGTGGSGVAASSVALHEIYLQPVEDAVRAGAAGVLCSPAGPGTTAAAGATGGAAGATAGGAPPGATGPAADGAGTVTAPAGATVHAGAATAPGGGAGQATAAAGPAGTATVPAGSATAPGGSATVPAGSATVPAGAPAAPAGSATAPGGSATVPAGSAPAAPGAPGTAGNPGAATGPGAAGSPGATEPVSKSPCGNPGLLIQILRSELGFTGFVLAGPGANPGTLSLDSGLDGEIPAPGRTAARYFTPAALRAALASKTITTATVNQAAATVLTEMDRFGLLGLQPAHPAAAPAAADARVIARTAADAATLLRNSGHALPLGPAELSSLALIGPGADQVIGTGPAAGPAPGAGRGTATGTAAGSGTETAAGAATGPAAATATGPAAATATGPAAGTTTGTAAGTADQPPGAL